jgi:hypothetical protein
MADVYGGGRPGQLSWSRAGLLWLLWRWTESQTRPPPVFFFPFLPCKDNQVYVKCVCSFDSGSLINSITLNPIVSQCLKCGWGLAPLILSITLSIFPQLPWLRSKFVKTQNESQQNKNKDSFEILFFKGHLPCTTHGK